MSFLLNSCEFLVVFIRNASKLMVDSEHLEVNVCINRCVNLYLFHFYVFIAHEKKNNKKMLACAVRPVWMNSFANAVAPLLHSNVDIFFLDLIQNHFSFVLSTIDLKQIRLLETNLIWIENLIEHFEAILLPIYTHILRMGKWTERIHLFIWINVCAFVYREIWMNK